MPNSSSRFRASYDFRGDTKAAQLSFSAGDIIDVDVQKKGSGGWVWGNIFGSPRNGWCPESYLIPHQTTTTAPPGQRTKAAGADHPSCPTTANKSDYYDDDEEEIDDGFSGPIMGGSSTDSRAFRESAPPGTCTKDNDTLTNPFA